MNIVAASELSHDVRYVYGVAVVRVLENRLIRSVDFDRLLEAEEGTLARLIQDSGYEVDASAPLLEWDIDRVCGGMMERTVELVCSFLDNPAWREFFFLENDCSNLKRLLVFHLRKDSPDSFEWGHPGIVPVELLERILETGDWSLLPDEMEDAVLEALRMAERVEAADASGVACRHLDALFVGRLMPARIERAGCPFLSTWYGHYADLYNLRILMRSERMGLSPARKREALVYGIGTLGTDLLDAASEAGGLDEMARLFSATDYADYVRESVEALGKGDATRLEVAADDILTDLLRTAVFAAGGQEPLFAYWWARRVETRNVAAVLLARRYGIESSLVKKKLRESYV